MQDQWPAGLPKRVEVGAEVARATVALRKVLGREHTLHVEVRDTPAYLRIDPAMLEAILRSMVYSVRSEHPQEVTLLVAKHRVDRADSVAGLADGWYIQIEVRTASCFTIYLPAAPDDEST